ncbi:hypothetical protein ID866_3453 [Astraeus odoratus]|nr:hypothetical protein ID866_3453 [Astraeus odoratus]
MSPPVQRARSGTIPSMEVSTNAIRNNVTIIVFGASGDLAKKKTFPALFGLYRNGFLPPYVHIVGYARTKMDIDEYHRRMTGYMKRDNSPDFDAKLEEFKNLNTYIPGGYEDSESFQRLNNHIKEIEKRYGGSPPNRLFYLALPPTVFIPVSQHAKQECYGAGINRIIVEKPFGKDLDSCRKLLKALKEYWTEDETYRIDHYLGKEMVKNLLVLRFGNVAMNAAWDKNSISNVQITIKEPFGTEGRGGYFDEYGVIRDILQNHLLQVLSILTMERPVSFAPEDIRDEKVKVLRAIPVISREDTLLGQYVAADGKPGYLDDSTVPKDSRCPTFAATVLWIHNPRWEGVPFIMKAGKALNEAKVEVRIQFKEATQGIFADIPRNELVVRIQPEEAVYLKLNAKTPGYSFRAIPTEMDLTYKKRFTDTKIPEAYEALILDALKGDHSNFVRDDELDVAWKIFTPILHWIDGKEEGEPPKPHPYPYGSRGPEQLDGEHPERSFESADDGFGTMQLLAYDEPVEFVITCPLPFGCLVVLVLPSRGSTFTVRFSPPIDPCQLRRVLDLSPYVPLPHPPPPLIHVLDSLPLLALQLPMSNPHDLFPLLYCPLCSPPVLLDSPTTLRCGHTVCSAHVSSPVCPVPTCSSTLRQGFTPNIPCSSRVAFFPAPLLSEQIPSGLHAQSRIDVRVNNIIQLLRETVLDSQDPSASSSDDESDRDEASSRSCSTQSLPGASSRSWVLSQAQSTIPDPPPSPTPHSPLHRTIRPPADFDKALAAELTCEICFMLLYQPVTTPCQHTFCILKAFYDAYESRGETIETEERHSRLDTPIFVCQLSFPGMPTLLHFFEPRYRLMLRRCLESSTPTFGMIMPPRAAPLPGHGTTAGCEFGTMLEIRSVQMLPDGRSMVETWGVHRFRILERGSLDGYMIGRVERIDDYEDDLGAYAGECEEGQSPSQPPSNTSPIATRPSIPIVLTRILPPPPPSPSCSILPLTPSSPNSSQRSLTVTGLMAACHAFLAQLRAGTAPWVVQRLNHTYGPQPPDSDPGAFSFWMGMVLPIEEHEKAKLLPVKSARLRLRMVVGWIEQLNSNWSVKYLDESVKW